MMSDERVETVFGSIRQFDGILESSLPRRFQFAANVIFNNNDGCLRGCSQIGIYGLSG
jgi:hypothetical protein